MQIVLKIVVFLRCLLLPKALRVGGGIDNIYKKAYLSALGLTLLELRNFKFPVKKQSNGNAPNDVLIIFLAFSTYTSSSPKRDDTLAWGFRRCSFQTGRAMRRPK